MLDFHAIGQQRVKDGHAGLGFDHSAFRTQFLVGQDD